MLDYKVQEETKRQKEQELTDISNTEIGDENVITTLNYNVVYTRRTRLSLRNSPTSSRWSSTTA